MKGIAGFYYVHVAESGIYECKAKGIFRKEKIKPLVGDNVEIEILSEEEKTGNIEQILQRKNELIRPAVANVDQALIIFAAQKPNPNFNLLDRFLVEMKRQEVPTVICFNKMDLESESGGESLTQIYQNSGATILLTSAKSQEGREQLEEVLTGKVTTVAGPSGVGKSSLINLLQSNVQMETGSISEKIERGKHTTRHAQLICINADTYIVDTPGFTTMYIEEMDAEELKNYYEEFIPYEQECRFGGCNHINEPDCRVKQAVEEGEISRNRYDNYCHLFEELKSKKKY